MTAQNAKTHAKKLNDMRKKDKRIKEKHNTPSHCRQNTTPLLKKNKKTPQKAVFHAEKAILYRVTHHLIKKQFQSF